MAEILPYHPSIFVSSEAKGKVQGTKLNLT